MGNFFGGSNRGVSTESKTQEVEQKSILEDKKKRLRNQRGNSILSFSKDDKNDKKLLGQ